MLGEFCFDFVCCLLNLRNHVCDLDILLRNVNDSNGAVFFFLRRRKHCLVSN